MARWDQTLKRRTKILKDELRFLGVKITEERAAQLQFLALRKYDRYDIYSPGETFLSRLMKWLENFDEKDRQKAMLIIHSLKFISQYELKELAAATFESSRLFLRKNVLKLPTENWSVYAESREANMNNELSKSIFLACTDDIMFDYLRRYAMQQVDSFEKDNFIEYYKMDESGRVNLPEYNRVFLIDQLSASGITAIRKEGKKWDGKLPRFWEIWQKDLEKCEVFYCPFMQSMVSKTHIETLLPQWIKERRIKLPFKVLPTCYVYVSPCLSSDNGSTIDESLQAAKLCRNRKYFSKFVDDRHINKGGPAHYCFGRAGLTLILQSNCPNNTVPLLWHSNNGWYPLFPRVSHHRGAQRAMNDDEGSTEN
jgi:hypothetical protein